jgi:hypothetical protein
MLAGLPLRRADPTAAQNPFKAFHRPQQFTVFKQEHAGNHKPSHEHFCELG